MEIPLRDRVIRLSEGQVRALWAKCAREDEQFSMSQSTFANTLALWVKYVTKSGATEQPSVFYTLAKSVVASAAAATKKPATAGEKKKQAAKQAAAKRKAEDDARTVTVALEEPASDADAEEEEQDDSVIEAQMDLLTAAIGQPRREQIQAVVRAYRLSSVEEQRRALKDFNEIGADSELIATLASESGTSADDVASAVATISGTLMTLSTRTK